MYFTPCLCTFSTVTVLYPSLKQLFHSACFYTLLTDCVQVPDYYDVIHNPMDLSTIRNKVHKYRYSTPSELLDDVRLIFANCIEYNARTTPEYRAGQALTKFFQSRVRELGLQEDSGPTSSPPAKKQRR